MILHISGETVSLYSCSFPQPFNQFVIENLCSSLPQFHAIVISNKRHWVNLPSSGLSRFAIGSTTLLNRSQQDLSANPYTTVCEFHYQGGLDADKWDEAQIDPSMGIGIQTFGFWSCFSALFFSEWMKDGMVVDNAVDAKWKGCRRVRGWLTLLGSLSLSLDW